MKEATKVFVSGCYDMPCGGHTAFFEEAATYGDLCVGIGSDRTVYELNALTAPLTQTGTQAIIEAWTQVA